MAFSAREAPYVVGRTLPGRVLFTPATCCCGMVTPMWTVHPLPGRGMCTYGHEEAVTKLFRGEFTVSVSFRRACMGGSKQAWPHAP